MTASLARHLEAPSTGWLRRYRVRVNGKVEQGALDALAEGIELDGIKYGPIEGKLDRVQGANCWLTLGLREGKNREVRKIMDASGPGGEPADPAVIRPVRARRAGTGRHRGGQAARARRPAWRGHG